METLLTPAHKTFIAGNAALMDVHEMARIINVRASIIYNHCRRKRIKFKRVRILTPHVPEPESTLTVALLSREGVDFADGVFNPGACKNWLF